MLSVLSCVSRSRLKWTVAHFHAITFIQYICNRSLHQTFHSFSCVSVVLCLFFFSFFSLLFWSFIFPLFIFISVLPEKYSNEDLRTDRCSCFFFLLICSHFFFSMYEILCVCFLLLWDKVSKYYMITVNVSDFNKLITKAICCFQITRYPM